LASIVIARAVRKEAVRKEVVRKEVVRKEVVRKEVIRKEVVRKKVVHAVVLVPATAVVLWARACVLGQQWVVAEETLGQSSQGFAGQRFAAQ